MPVHSIVLTTHVDTKTSFYGVVIGVARTLVSRLSVAETDAIRCHGDIRFDVIGYGVFHVTVEDTDSDGFSEG